MRLIMRAKAGTKVASRHPRGLRSLAVERPQVGPRVLVYSESRARRTDDGIDINPLLIDRLGRSYSMATCIVRIVFTNPVLAAYSGA